MSPSVVGPSSRARRTRLAGALLLFFLTNGIVLSLGLGLLSAEEPPFTTLDHTRGFLSGHSGGDSWDPMRVAWHRWREDPSRSLYTPFFEQGLKFLYPPTSVLLLRGIGMLSGGALATNEGLGLLARLAVLVAIAATAWLLISRGTGSRVATGSAPLLEAVAVLLLGLSFAPLVHSGTLGQAQAWIHALLALALIAFALGRDGLAGALVGAICWLKPHFAVLALWASVRGRSRFTVALGAVAGLGAASSLLIFGVDDALDYLRLLGVLSERGESYHANQSVNGLLHRALQNGNNLEWRARELPPAHPLVEAGTFASSLALLALGIVWRRREHVTAPLLDLGIAILACTMAAPTAWAHHYGIVPALAVVALVAALALRARGAVVGIAFAWLLCGQYVQAVERLADGRWNVLQSHVFFGGLLLLGVMCGLRRRAWEAGERAAP